MSDKNSWESAKDDVATWILWAIGLFIVGCIALYYMWEIWDALDWILPILVVVLGGGAVFFLLWGIVLLFKK
jgi:hypothetical protein